MANIDLDPQLPAVVSFGGWPTPADTRTAQFHSGCMENLLNQHQQQILVVMGLITYENAYIQ